jgi:KamA family protein
MHYTPYTNTTIDKTPQFMKLPRDKRHELEVLLHVFHFKTNNYVVNELIDWENYANDPIFTLNFPRKEMLDENEFNLLSQLIKNRSAGEVIDNYASKIKSQLKPRHPPQATNLLQLSEPGGITGLYHQYPQTLLAFTAGAKTCHAYCMYCYRWMAFAFDDIQFNYCEPHVPAEYLRSHPDISDVLFTGGDALHMTATELKRYITPLLEIDSVRTIRLGTRILTWWPYRFVTDHDADELLAFFEFIIAKGKHLALMAHISHPRELMTNAVQQAIRRIRSTGAVIRCQCPVVKRLNDSKVVWIALLQREMLLGLIPYYMFITSSKTSNPVFTIPLATALQIYQDAQRALSGLAKTLRGPVMTNGPFKILIDGIADIDNEKVFVLKILQSSDANLIGKILFAQHDDTALDFDQLKPALGSDPAFFQ